MGRVMMAPWQRGWSEPEFGQGGDPSEVEVESEPWGRARRSPSSSGAEAESEPWGRARRSSSFPGAEAESEPWGRARWSSSSSGVEAESEPWGRARRSPSSEAETGAEPWRRVRRSFLCRPRLDLAAVDLTLVGGTTVGAGQAALYSCQVGQRSCEVTAVTLALSTGARVRIRCQVVLALNAPAIRSVGVAIWPRLLLCKVCPNWASGESVVRPLLEGTLG
jgi:hypothetical protein